MKKDGKQGRGKGEIDKLASEADADYPLCRQPRLSMSSCREGNRGIPRPEAQSLMGESFWFRHAMLFEYARKEKGGVAFTPIEASQKLVSRNTIECGTGREIRRPARENVEHHSKMLSSVFRCSRMIEIWIALSVQGAIALQVVMRRGEAQTTTRSRYKDILDLTLATSGRKSST